jgi:cystathionine beta-lyase/cystathionine gamma-synthase
MGKMGYFLVSTSRHFLMKATATMSLHLASQHPETLTIHAHQPPCPATGAVTPPLYQTSTFTLNGIEFPNEAGYFYTRMANPTTLSLEKVLADLEKAQHGLAFASGMGAISCALLGSLKPGDHVLAEESLYGGTYKLMTQVLVHHGIEVTFANLQNLESLPEKFQTNTRMLYWETPSNPMLKVLNTKALAVLAKKYGALSCVDNTFATPILQNPLNDGVDIVVHSVSKYMGGHSDVIGGALMVNEKGLYTTLKLYQEVLGATPDPFAAWLTLRGLKTLAVRMRQHCDNALKVAYYLEKHPKVEQVLYPGLPSHPGHALAAQQMSGQFGGIVTINLTGTESDAQRFLEKTQLFRNAVSLGGVESLCCHPASSTHRAASKEALTQMGIAETTIRLAVGIEHPDDLIADLEQALAVV